MFTFLNSRNAVTNFDGPANGPPGGDHVWEIDELLALIA
jgi:hypothetical protein